jgi:GTP-binding protein
VIADRNINTLVDYRYTRKFIGKRGENGGGADQYGAGGDDIVLRMPVGTVVTDLNVTGDSPRRPRRAREESDHSPRAARAASATFTSNLSTNRAPRQCTKGEQGEEHELDA